MNQVNKMTNSYENSEEIKTRDIVSQPLLSKKQVIKFLLIPGYRAKEISYTEYELGKIKSKRKIFRRFLNFLTILGVIILLFVFITAIFAPWLSIYSFNDLISGGATNWWGEPSPSHPLGQTKNGWDIYGRILYGGRTSLIAAAEAVLIAATIGVLVGITTGYYGGWVDRIIMWVLDLMTLFPTLIIVIIVVFIFGSSLEIIVFTFALFSFPYYARNARGVTLQIKNEVFIEAGKVSGCSDYKIMIKYIFPNVISPILIIITFDIAGTIMWLSTIAYLGFFDPTAVNWGNDVAFAAPLLFQYPWASFWPGLMIFLGVLGFMLFGDGLRDAVNPKLNNE